MSNQKEKELEDFTNLLISSFKIIGHEHPLIFCFALHRRKKCDGWTCNKCSKDFPNTMPSFYCSFCDYDLCQYCIGSYQLSQFKLDNTELYERLRNINDFSKNNEKYDWYKKYPDHKHALVFIGRINKYTTWVCNNCEKNFRNIDPSYYCSLCDYDICLNCYKNKTGDSDNNEDQENLKEEKKPVIYLYPEKPMEISVQLNFKNHKFTAIYPKFSENNTWKVHANPNGDIIINNKTYPYLFWEAESYLCDEMKEGFIVKNDDAEKFLEEKLKLLGLNDKESTDFITFWLPVLLKNKVSLCTFQTKKFFENIALNITPKPDSMIRVFLSIKKLDKPVNIKEQKLEPNERKGFTVVEWGGSNY